MYDVRAKYYDGTVTLLKTGEHWEYLPIWVAWNDYYQKNGIKPPKEEVFTKTEYPPDRKHLQEILDRNNPFEKITEFQKKEQL